MGQIINLQLHFARQRLGSQEAFKHAWRIAHKTCDGLGIAYNGKMYREYISDTLCADHRQAALYWALRHHPEWLTMPPSARSHHLLAEAIDAQVRRVIPPDVFWSHD